MLVGNALYFVLLWMKTAVKYDLELQTSCVVDLPPGSFCCLITTEDGKLDAATIHNSTLCNWSMKAGYGLDAGAWIKTRVIQLNTLLHVDLYKNSHNLAGFVDGMGIIFFEAKGELLKIDLKTNQVTKVFDASGVTVVPYMSFHSPGTILLLISVLPVFKK